MPGEARSTDGAKAPFMRTTSGLVREMSITDAAIYGILATGGIYAFIYLFPYPQALSPGVSVPLTVLFTLLFSFIVYFVYAAIGSAMPRAGGDYVYETRTIARFVGFVVPWACQLVFWLAFITTGYHVMNTLGIAPLLDALGLHGAAAWVLTDTGGFAVIGTTIVASWFLTRAGIRVYSRLQRYVLLPLLVVGACTIVGVLVANVNADFVQAFNSYPKNEGLTVGAVHAFAANAGYQPAGFSLRNTLIWMVFLGGVIPYTMFSAQGLLGEVKHASNLGRLFRVFSLTGIIVALGMILLPWMLLEHIAGSAFIKEFAVAYVSGGITVPYSPNINIFAQMLAPSTPVVLLISLGFIAGGFGIGYAVFLTATRVMMAMSLDGLLPSFVSDVSPRHRTPVKAITVWTACALAVAAAFSFIPHLERSIMGAGVLTSLAVIGVTSLGAALFPFTAPGIYALSPVARLRVGPVPVITIVGALGFLGIAALTFAALFEPALALTTRAARVTLLVTFGSGAVFYFAWKLYRRARGVDTSLATRVVPPD